MLRILFSIALAITIAACSTTGGSVDYRQKSPPEFRAAAATIMGHDPTAVEETPGALQPRIKLNPSPGMAVLAGERNKEVLTSNLKSGAYIAFVGEVPVTRYFHLLGRADCDDWVYLQLMNPKMARSNSQYYTNGDFRGGEAPWKCLGLFHERYHAQSDERLKGSDGAIFDPASARFLEVDAFTIGHKKLHMDGWAILFAEPTPDELHTRLAAKPTTAADRLQMRAALYWIEQHHATEYADEVRALLPIGSKFDALNDWHEVEHAALQTLAAIAADETPTEVWWTILEAGIATWQGADTAFTVPGLSVGRAPYIAANVLVCQGDKKTVKRLVRVVTDSVISQHKAAAGKALAVLDAKALQQLINQGKTGDLTRKMQATLSRDPIPYQCPYRSFQNAN
ncbi:MAG: hypothetical protein K8H75_11865 [Sulfuricella sp.]|nr:hypothetical protein [Sulfuricella sp.]